MTRVNGRKPTLMVTPELRPGRAIARRILAKQVPNRERRPQLRFKNTDGRIPLSMWTLPTLPRTPQGRHHASHNCTPDTCVGAR